MSHHLHSFFPFLLLIVIIFTSESNNTNCPSSNCGDITIQYPFRRIHSDPDPVSCGYHGFGINCTSINGHEHPIMTLGGDLYLVRNITYEHKIIRLVDYNVSDVITHRNHCPRVRHNINLGTLPFRFTEHNVNLSFHFNCTHLPNLARAITCTDANRRSSMFNIIDSKTEYIDWRVYSCMEEVNTTVVQLDGIGALTNGFELTWSGMEGCENCQESDERCGATTNNKLCYCSDGRIKTGDCKGGNSDWKLKLVIGLASGLFGITIMFVIFYLWTRRNNKKCYNGSTYISRNVSSYESSVTDIEMNGPYDCVQIFKYRELEKATNHFDPANELGDGGFGTVYRGKLKDGRIVAVKRLYENNYRRVKQFMNEVELLAHLRHQNLVSLYGCTTHHSRELLLVYEYIPNGTVADHLHGAKSNPSSLTWTTRMNIAIETASALVYLHASDVVHRDVKTNNILLDNGFTVKVADFGLSRLFPDNVTHVSTAPQGTPGYVDPEYHECYHLTNKSDVYSFGVVLVELISSKPAVDINRHRHEINLSNMAINKIRNDELDEFVDPNLGFGSDYEVRKMIKAVAELGFQCLQNERDCRPTMNGVLECLMGIKNGEYKYEKQDVFDGTSDDAVLLMNRFQNKSPDSVVIGWSTSTMSTSSE